MDVGRRWSYGDAARWGPGGNDLSDDGRGGGGDLGRSRSRHNGGYATTPRDIQQACVELVKQQLNRLGTDLISHPGGGQVQLSDQQSDA